MESNRVMAQDIGKFRKNTKDQYYTKVSVAKKCIDTIHTVLAHADTYAWVEPSAGNGAFLNILPDTYDALGIDIDPKIPSIIMGNFLDWTPTIEKPRICFGNPPFGRQGSLAKSFIQHAAKHANVIAFILPRSFVKPSMSRAFPLEFHCMHSETLEKNAFEVNGTKYHVPCVFQIWEKREFNRVLDVNVKESGFKYVKGGAPFHIAFRRVGGQAGKCYGSVDGVKYSPQSHYFLKLDDIHVAHIQKIIDAVNAHVFPSNTVGPRSLSKGEANAVLNHVLESLSS